MATTPNEGENPIRPDQTDVVQTDLPDLGPATNPDDAPLDPDADPDLKEDEL